jgi:hypothetical protein
MANLLIEGNNATLGDLYSVLETFNDKNLQYKYKDSRTIAQIIKHIACSQNCMYLDEFILGEKGKCTCQEPKTIKQALKIVQDLKVYYAKIVKGLDKDELAKTFTTEWGQSLTKELALFQSITHTAYHISEICFLAGLGGFYKGTLG